MSISNKFLAVSLGILMSHVALAADSGNVGNSSENLEKATFAGGCFWCMVKPFKTDGVHFVTSGYAGGHVKSPTYEQVVAGSTGHREAIQVVYDPNIVDYGTLLDIFWQNVDPFDGRGQFCDKGFQYTSAIFAHNEMQRKLAEESLDKLRERFNNQEIKTSIVDYTNYYEAEEYHQDYYQKNPIRYKFYRSACGRDRRLKEVWK